MFGEKTCAKSYQVYLLLGLAKILVWWQNQVIASDKTSDKTHKISPSKTPKPKCIVWIAMQVLGLARNDKIKEVKEVKLFC